MINDKLEVGIKYLINKKNEDCNNISREFIHGLVADCLKPQDMLWYKQERIEEEERRR